MVDGVVNVIDGGGVAESILDAADFILDLIEAKGGIGEQNGLVFDGANFILDFIEAKDTAVDGVVDLVDCVVDVIYGVIDVVDDGCITDGVLDGANLIFDFVQTEGGIGEQNGLIFYQADFILDLVEAKDAAVDGVIDLIDGVVGLIDGVVNVVDDGCVADSVFDDADFVFDLI